MDISKHNEFYSQAMEIVRNYDHPININSNHYNMACQIVDIYNSLNYQSNNFIDCLLELLDFIGNFIDHIISYGCYEKKFLNSLYIIHKENPSWGHLYPMDYFRINDYKNEFRKEIKKRNLREDHYKFIKGVIKEIFYNKDENFLVLANISTLGSFSDDYTFRIDAVECLEKLLNKVSILRHKPKNNKYAHINNIIYSDIFDHDTKNFKHKMSIQRMKKEALRAKNKNYQPSTRLKLRNKILDLF